MATVLPWRVKIRTRVLGLLGLGLALGSAAWSQTLMETEPVKTLTRTNKLVTCAYAPAEKEKPFLEKVPTKELITGSFAQGYDIHAKNDLYVSWFGVVRGISPIQGKENAWQLVVEQKYFDNMTDCHIMLVSMNGSGDFLARVETTKPDIPALALVRVYGKVNQENGTPVVAAEFIRVWPWSTFTFTDLGAEDKSNPRWRKQCRVCRTARIYRPFPDEKYYRDALGDPGQYGAALK